MDGVMLGDGETTSIEYWANTWIRPYKTSSFRHPTRGGDYFFSVFTC